MCVAVYEQVMPGHSLQNSQPTRNLRLMKVACQSSILLLKPQVSITAAVSLSDGSGRCLGWRCTEGVVAARATDLNWKL